MNFERRRHLSISPFLARSWLHSSCISWLMGSILFQLILFLRSLRYRKAVIVIGMFQERNTGYSILYFLTCECF